MNEIGSVGIGHYGAVLKRQWKTVVALTLLGLLAVTIFLLIAPPRITASTLVNVNVIVADPFNPSRPASGLLDASTEDQLASSYVVAKEAEQTLNSGDTAAELRDGTSVTVGANATTVRVSYTADSAQRAREGANAIANSYLLYRQSQADARKTRMLDQLAQQLASLKEALGDGTSDGAGLGTRISDVEFQISQLTAVDTTGGEVITPAGENPVLDQRGLILASGPLVGLLLGIILAFIFNALGRLVRDDYDVERAGAGPVLVHLSGLKPVFPARDENMDEFRMLRERLLAPGYPLSALTVIDEIQSEDTSDVAANLAMVLAQAGKDVELVVMGASEEYMGLLSRGLQLSATRSATGTNVFGSGCVPGLRVVQPLAGAVDRGADVYLTTAVRQRVLDRPADTLVILGLPTHAPHASRLAASRLADAALLVVESGRTPIKELSWSVKQVHDVGAQVVGTVITPRGRRIISPSEEPRPAGYKHLEPESTRT